MAEAPVDLPLERDPEAEKVLAESFPDFFYGKILKFSQIFDISKRDLKKEIKTLETETIETELCFNGDEADQFDSYIPKPPKVWVFKDEACSEPDHATKQLGTQQQTVISAITGLPIDTPKEAILLPVSTIEWEKDIVWDLEDTPCLCGRSFSNLEAPSIHCSACLRPFHRRCIDIPIGVLPSEWNCRVCAKPRPRILHRTVLKVPVKKQAKKIAPPPQTEEGKAENPKDKDLKGAGGESSLPSDEIAQGESKEAEPGEDDEIDNTQGNPNKPEMSILESFQRRRQEMIESVVEEEISIFDIDNPDLVLGSWEKEIVWDGENPDSIRFNTAVLCDPNDRHILFDVPLTSYPFNFDTVHQKEKRKGGVEADEAQADDEEEEEDDFERYNISNDEFYIPKGRATTTYSLRKCLDRRVVEHSGPAMKLHPSLFPTQLSPQELLNFHRLPLRHVVHTSPVSVSPCGGGIVSRDGNNIASVIKLRKDLTARDMDLVLVEYAEQYPPLIMRPGMCTLIQNYYKRRGPTDNSCPRQRFGAMAYISSNDASPFLGDIVPGSMLQSLENNMFRCPIYSHAVPETDFLVIRSSKDEYYIRRVQGLFTAGQLCPKIEVIAPNSKKHITYMRDRLSVYISRLFKQSKDNIVRVEDVKRAFPTYTEPSIRKRLKEMAEFKRGGGDNGSWQFRGDPKTDVSESELQMLMSPEQVCAYESMMANWERLKDAGYGLSSIEKQFHENDNDDEDAFHVTDEVRLAHWRTSADFIACIQRKCLIAVTGPGEPTGCGEGFSYLRLRTKHATTTKEEQKLLPKITLTKKPLAGTLQATDSDLRKLNLKDARKLLVEKYGQHEEFVNSLGRWDVIKLVRKFSTEAAEIEDSDELASKFSRGARSSTIEHNDRFKTECQRVFDLQNRQLGSNEVLSSDEDDDDDDEADAELKELQNDVNRQLTSSAPQSDADAQRDLREFLDSINEKTKRDKEKAQRLEGDDEEGGKPTSPSAESSSAPKKRYLRILRTHINSEGKQEDSEEILKDPVLIKAYLYRNATRSASISLTMLDASSVEKMRREKRRIRDRLRRLRRRAAGLPSRVRNNTSRAIKNTNMKCGACGQVGHMKTNKDCPMFGKASSDITPLRKDAVGIVKRTEALKLSINTAKAEEVRRGSMVLKVPRAKLSQSTPASPSNPQSPAPFSPLPNVDEMSELPPAPMLDDSSPFPVFSPPVVDGSPEKASHGDLILTLTLPPLNNVDPTPEPEPQPADLNTPSLKIKLPILPPKRKRVEEVDSTQNFINEAPKLTKSDRGKRNPDVVLNSLLAMVIKPLTVNPDFFIFVNPVSSKMYFDYYTVIRHPMDLSTISSFAQDHKYQSVESFREDLRQIARNAFIYNGSEHAVYRLACTLREEGFKELELRRAELEKLEATIQGREVPWVEFDTEAEEKNDLAFFAKEKPYLASLPPNPAPQVSRRGNRTPSFSHSPLKISHTPSALGPHRSASSLQTSYSPNPMLSDGAFSPETISPALSPQNQPYSPLLPDFFSGSPTPQQDGGLESNSQRLPSLDSSSEFPYSTEYQSQISYALNDSPTPSETSVFENNTSAADPMDRQNPYPNMDEPDDASSYDDGSVTGRNTQITFDSLNSSDPSLAQPLEGFVDDGISFDQRSQLTYNELGVDGDVDVDDAGHFPSHIQHTSSPPESQGDNESVSKDFD